MALLVIAGAYLAIGAIALCAFDHRTKRIRSKLVSKSVEAQSTLAMSNVPLPGSLAGGTYVGSKTALVILAVAAWLFWPAVFIGAMTEKTEKKEDK